MGAQGSEAQAYTRVCCWHTVERFAFVPLVFPLSPCTHAHILSIAACVFVCLTLPLSCLLPLLPPGDAIPKTPLKGHHRGRQPSADVRSRLLPYGRRGARDGAGAQGDVGRAGGRRRRPRRRRRRSRRPRSKAPEHAELYRRLRGAQAADGARRRCAHILGLGPWQRARSGAALRCADGAAAEGGRSRPSGACDGRGRCGGGGGGGLGDEGRRRPLRASLHASTRTVRVARCPSRRLLNR